MRVGNGETMTNAHAGWYDDGSGTGTKRWWDGQVWTDRYQQPPAGSGMTAAARRIEDDAVAGAQPRPAALSADLHLCWSPVTTAAKADRDARTPAAAG